MPAQGHNRGFHVLDDFVCDAIHPPAVPLANPANQGRNEGMFVIAELLFEAGKEPSTEKLADPECKTSISSAALDGAIKSEVQRLAALIAASTDPVGTVALFQKLLLAELATSP